MQVYTLLKKGEWHPVFCEDFLTYFDIDKNYFCAAVMDGCSSGKNSHFASVLFAKVLHKVIKQIVYEIPFWEDITLAKLSKKILSLMHKELRETQNLLFLEDKEMLATFLILIYDKDKKSLHITATGDGFIMIDGQLTDLDQNNVPDYWAYHLKKEFQYWYKNHTKIFTSQAPQDISISTDGIDSFRTVKIGIPEDFSLMNFLLADSKFDNTPTMLQRKFNILNKKYGFLNGDDLGIVRVRF